MTQRGPEDELSGDREPVTELEDVETLKQSLAEEKTRAEGYLANWQRAEADFINYKRRAEQEREESSRFANAALMLNFLPALDDMERAFAAIPPRLEKAGWVDGMRLIERKLKSTLEAQGLSHIEALGEPFDPHIHEAVRQAPGKEGMVIEEVQKGYKFRDRIIRPTMVVVGNGEEQPGEKEA